ncbi:hypothetical protein niasHS_009832 [Heterodera schachtii]|uniref:Proteasome activator complex subunit 4-like HEAT repeat-like domain-containing protein n=1 Tax=Heterodera schachtii TaxID=97005 RepID=A0ABD2JAQ2_HETSC
MVFRVADHEFNIHFGQFRTPVSPLWFFICSCNSLGFSSFIQLTDLARDLIVSNFSSFQIEYYLPDSVMPLAVQLLSDYPGICHKPEFSCIGRAVADDRKRQEFALASKRGVVLHFFKLLTSDIINTRKIAIGFRSSWLKIRRQKAVKEDVVIPDCPPGRGPGAQWPITFGIRCDNKFLLYDAANSPSDADKRDSAKFHSNVHPGFYTWPRRFRIFNDILLPEFLEMLDKLLDIGHESHHRLASELVTGMVSGSKLWKYVKVKKVQERLEQQLTDTFLGLTEEVENIWGTALATIFGACEPRVTNWLIQMLFGLAKRPTEISTQIKTRLYLLQSGLNQYEWRIPNEWRRLFELCMDNVNGLGCSYQNVRLRIGSCLATISSSDFKKIACRGEWRRRQRRGRQPIETCHR